MTGQVHPAILVMGVSGVGKTTIAATLAGRLGAAFVEADEFHPPQNVAAMARGVPLSDEMRRPWLIALGEAVAARRREGAVVFACSALKRAYRDILADHAGPLEIVHLAAPRTLVAARLSGRTGHFMPPSLLESQIADLQPPGPDEAPVILDVAPPVDAIVRSAAAEIGRRHPGLAPSRSGT